MSHPSHLATQSVCGSALVLVLLVTALLATITVSFLSTSRVEQIAARNFSRQNAATGLAEMATQQAMAKIQQGFTVNGNATTVITTQPGAIWQYTFSGGSCSAVSGKNPVDLFTTNGTIDANLNNLQNPSSNSSATTNQFTITGNASEQINVPMENITSNGTIIGRIAYYVDDEGTKLNVNAATDDRNTLNISSSKSLSLSATTTGNLSTANLTTFRNFVAGNLTSNSSSILNWNHFFRHEQFMSHTYSSVANATLSSIATGLNDSLTNNLRSELYKSTTVTPISDYHIKRTPWGTPRLFINDLATDSASATASVNAIFNALSDTRLRDIYGSTFADKYTPLGLKQIAANMLQIKDPNTNTASNSFNSTVPAIGANGSQLVATANCCVTANNTRNIPAEYFGRAPYPYINEIGVTVAIAHRDRSLNYNPPLTTSLIGFQIRPFVSIVNPELSIMPQSQVDTWKIEMRINSFTFDMDHEDINTGATYSYPYGPTGYENGDPFGHTSTERITAINRRNARLGGTSQFIEEASNWGWTNGLFSTTASGNYTSTDGWGNDVLLSLTSWSQTLNPGQELQLNCYNYVNNWDMGAFVLKAPNTTRILDIYNMRIKFDYIILSSVSGGTAIIKDFVVGNDTGEIDCWLQAPNPGQNASNPYPNGWPSNALGNSHPWIYGLTPISNGAVLPPRRSVKRIDGRMRLSANTTLSANATLSNSTRAWSTSGNSEWVKNTPLWPAPMRAASTNATTANTQAYPSVTSGNPIPGDPPVATQTDPRYDFPSPFSSILQFTSANVTTPNSSVFTSPQELGKVHTNVQHRKLRMTTQHPNEVATSNGGGGNQTFIPDWAMLDVISFGSNVTSVPAPAPLNLNGQFYVPSGSPQPAARTAGVAAALKALDSASTVGSPFPPFTTATINRTQYIGGSGNVSSTIAGNISNLTWSTGNFTTGNATWGKGNATNDDPSSPQSRRKTAGFPANQFVLPAEVTEIRSVSDVLPLDSYTGNSTNIKGNEGRLSALFPGATTQSRFFTIYAYAQALDKNLAVDSESVTKTLVEVIENSSTIPSTYTVKKLYSQPIQSQ